MSDHFGITSVNTSLPCSNISAITGTASAITYNKTALWLQLRQEAVSRRIGAATGVDDILLEAWLYAMVFYREAKALIDAPDMGPQTK